MAGFISEWRPASFRNGGRHQIGIGGRIASEFAGNHTFRATGVTAYLKNDGTLERAARMANHASTRTTLLYERRAEEVTLDEVERILV